MGDVVQVVKRNGQKTQPFDEAKLRRRCKVLLEELTKQELISPDSIDMDQLMRSVESGLKSSMTAQELDELLAEQIAYLGIRHPDYSRLAGCVAVTNLRKRTFSSILDIAESLYKFVSEQTNLSSPLISTRTYEVIKANAKRLDEAIDHSRDFRLDYFGYKTLERSYLLRVRDRRIAERPQHLYMRVAVGIHMEDIDRVIETYDCLSKGEFIHASPTLFSAGTPQPQMSSCFLVAMKDDSIEGIYDTLKQCAMISKAAGGIGLHTHNIRATGSYIRGTNGVSNGLVPMLRVFNQTSRYVDQGGGKRKGAFAVYLEPWHGDVFEYLALKKNTGAEEARARDLFYALWIPDLFMQRVLANGDWSLMCPNQCPGLSDVYGDEFVKVYEGYEKEGRFLRKVKAREVWNAILESQIETGTPYMLYKDACNSKSNQKNLGTIKCSNLCTEIVEYTSADETAVCNLASLSLPAYVNVKSGDFDHEKLYRSVRIVTRNLNKVIDRNYYPTVESQRSNMRHRPVGIGVQGLADVFHMLKLTFTGTAAKQLNREIFETIYYAAVDTSCELAKEFGTYPSYKDGDGCPISKGVFQFDMWEEEAKKLGKPSPVVLSSRWDWEGLRRRVVEHGVRNSLLVAPMPTASTSQILGNNECIEPYTSNLYVRRVLSGEYPVINKFLVRDLSEQGLWNETVRELIMAGNGSVQHIDIISEDIKERYKTVWELRQKDIIDMAVDRAVFVDQSQSLNLFVEEPTLTRLSSMHRYAWSSGLKTGMYYLRTRPAADAIKFTVAANVAAAVQSQIKKGSSAKTDAAVASAAPPAKKAAPSPVSAGQEDDDEGCLMCGS